MSVALPSTLRPARVSITSNDDRLRTDSGGGGMAGATSTASHESTSASGQPLLPSSSPGSATWRFYESSSARGPSSSRVSVASAAGQLPAPRVVGSLSRSSLTSRPSGASGLPSILPNSAFLTPRKPSHTPRQYSPSQQQLQTSNSNRAPAHAQREDDVSRSDNEESFFASQQGDPTLFVARQRSARRSEADATTIASTTPGTNPAGSDSLRGRPSLSRHGSVSNHGHGVSSSPGHGSTASPDTTAMHITNSHARSESRQETLRSRASQEPLISSDGLPMISGNSRLRGNPGTFASNKRKNSRTGSITSLLGMRSPSSSQGRQQSSFSGDIPPSGMSAVPESSEAGTPVATQLRGPPDGVDQGRPLYLRAEHTAVPILSPKTNKPMRNYEVYRTLQANHKQRTRAGSRSDKDGVSGPNEKASNAAQAYGSTDYGGNNVFLLAGRVVTSGDSVLPFLGSLAIAVLLPVLFFAFESEWLWGTLETGTGIGSSGGKAIIFLFAYSTLIMWTSMLRTSLRDPGIIIKGLDKEPDWESVAVPVGDIDDLTGTGMGQRPKLRYFRIKDEMVASKWCETCQTYRPPRTSHCRLCDVCTEQTDHHCSFLNNCIGRRNYSSFIAFLIAAVVSASFALGVSIAHLAVNAGLSSETYAFWKDWRNIGSIVLVVFTGAVGTPVAGLLAYHVRLIWLSRTTIEMLRPKYPSDPNGPSKGKPANPFAYSRRFDNIVYNLCKPMDLYSAIQPHALAEKDARQENPAFFVPRQAS